MVLAAVVPGTEAAQSQRALSLGVKESTPLKNLHIITLWGTLDQILRYATDNADLLEIYEEYMIIAENPAETGDDQPKSVTLQGHVEELTSVSVAHNLGFTGKGTTIAVIDTGLDPSHPEFGGRVIGEACFATNGTEEIDGILFTYTSPCSSEASADPKSTINYISNFNHGSHTTGIAAGNGGIAPEANIVAIQIFTDISYKCTEDDSFYDWCPWEDFDDEDDTERDCCLTASLSKDSARAYDFLIEHAADYPNLVAVNLSYANSVFHETACDNIIQYDYFRRLLEVGVITVNASGNEYKNNELPESACTSNSFTVGALANTETPLLLPDSNHSSMINMTAPGDNIYSALYPRFNPYMEVTIYYGEESGTSMAAPMVTGAFAILRQIFPNRSPEALKQTLIDLSTKEVTHRRNCHPYYIENGMCPAEFAEITILPESKPVLDFSNL